MKALDEAKRWLKEAKTASVGFTDTLKNMQRWLDELSGYKESEAFKKDAIAHVAAHPPEAVDILYSDEAVGRCVIQGYFNSPSDNCLLSEAISWVMSMGAA